MDAVNSMCKFNGKFNNEDIGLTIPGPTDNLCRVEVGQSETYASWCDVTGSIQYQLWIIIS